MKKLALALALYGLLSAASAEEIVARTLLSDGSTNTWTQADLVAALQLLNRRYHRETDAATGTTSGRAAWHGKIKSPPVVDTNALTRTTVYEDGTVFVDPFVPSPPAKKLPPPVMTNGVPARLAAARLRQRDADAVTNVTVVIEAGVAR